MYIKRDIEDKIAKYIHTPEILAIVGPRQSGKTTLISHIYSNYKEKSNDGGVKLEIYTSEFKDNKWQDAKPVPFKHKDL